MKMRPGTLWLAPVLSGAVFIACWYTVRAATGLQSTVAS